jgi:hypothetical protein
MATRDLSKHIFVDRPVSKYVIEFLELEAGDQDCLIALKRPGGWKCEDSVMIAARALKHIAGRYYVRKFKFCFDEGDQTVYCVAHEDYRSSFYRAYCVSIGEDTVVFYQVKSIVVRKNSVRAYLDILVRIKVVFFSQFSLFFFVDDIIS